VNTEGRVADLCGYHRGVVEGHGAAANELAKGLGLGEQPQGAGDAKQGTCEICKRKADQVDYELKLLTPGLDRKQRNDSKRPRKYDPSKPTKPLEPLRQSENSKSDYSAPLDIRYLHTFDENYKGTGSAHPGRHTLYAMDQQHGRVGQVDYYPPLAPGHPLEIDYLDTHHTVRGRGIASGLMDEVQRRHPGIPIDHGDRTEHGAGWWEKYSDGKDVSDGRTMAARRHAKSHEYNVTVQGPQGYEDKVKSVEGPLYHGGRARVGEGDLIVPGRKTNPWGDEGPKSRHVFFTTNPATAQSYATESRGHVYEVEPTGDFGPDYNGDDFKSKHPLKVIRKVPKEEWGARTAAGSDAFSRFFTPIPKEEQEAQRRRAEPQPERINNRTYSIDDVSKHYDWEGFDEYEISHLVHHPAQAQFSLEHVPVKSLRHSSESGALQHIPSYHDIVHDDEDEQDRMNELDRGYDQGSNIPPIVVVRDGKHHIIADGSHRAAIHARNGETHIPAFVTERTIHHHTAASVADDPERWEHYQDAWDHDRPEIEHSKDHGAFTLHAEPQNEYGDREIHAITPDGQYVGQVYFGEHPSQPGRLEGAPQVRMDHRRRGIASAMYDYASEIGKAPMAPADSHTDDAAAFWKARTASGGHYCKVCKENHEYESDAEAHQDSHTDWDEHYPGVDEIHRGIGVHLPQELHDRLHADDEDLEDSGDSRGEVMHDLVGHLNTKPGGWHWTTNRSKAHEFAEDYGGLADDEHGTPLTHVILTGHRPARDHIETDPHKLAEDEHGGGVSAYDTYTGEREVPLKQGTKVHVKSIDWKQAHEHGSRAYDLQDDDEYAGPRHVTAGRYTAKWIDDSPLSWDSVGERHPKLYGDPDVHGEEADGADGEGIGWAANQLAHSRPSDPDAENHGSWDLEFHAESVDPKHIDYFRHDPHDRRVSEAWRGYTKDARQVPPLVLVHRHGVYQVADGHHRAQAAAKAGKRVRAYVAYSPYPDEPDANGEKAPYNEAEPHPGNHTASRKTAALENPYNKSFYDDFPNQEHNKDTTHPEEWYHGSTEHFTHFDDPSDRDHRSDYESGPHNEHVHWNNWLGTHFSSREDVAADFSRGNYQEREEGDEPENGSVTHAKLHIKNPKVYKSEFDMDREAYGREYDRGNHPVKHDPEFEGEWEGDPHLGHHEDLRKQKDLVPNGTGGFNDNRTRFMRWLGAHPDSKQIGLRFKKHLEGQGHDGVVYGNEIERAEGQGATHPSAAAFRPHQIEITQHHLYDHDHRDTDPENPYQCKQGDEAREMHRTYPPVGHPELPFESSLGLWVMASMPGQHELFHAEPTGAQYSPKEDWHERMVQKHYVPGSNPDFDEELANKKTYCDDCNDEHSKNEGHRPCRYCGERHQDMDDTEEHEAGYTDWDEHYPHIGDEVHRGLPVSLPEPVHSLVHGEGHSDAEKAEALSQHLSGRNLGMHWSAHLPSAKDFTLRTAEHGDTEVIVHAHRPDRDDIETDPDNLRHGQVFGFDEADEAEVPLRDRTDLRVKGISWRRKPFSLKSHLPKNEWTRHDFAEPHHHTAKVSGMKHIAHDSGDGERIFHCPFCGAGQVLGRSDGTVECGYCNQHFTVQVQPQFPSFPQTINGMPVDIPGMPGQIDTGMGGQPGLGGPQVDPETGEPIEGPPGADDASGVPGAAEGAPGEAGPPEEEEGDDDGKPDFLKGSSRYYRTAAGDLLDEERYLRHLAIAHGLEVFA
jgi:hypothetical protein